MVFALVAVYFINLFFFQNYVIPSSSLEKSLLTGDYLFVSKVSYGPRIPETPLTMPLTQHTLPVVDCKSYVEWPHWDYRRAKGLGKVELREPKTSCFKASIGVKTFVGISLISSLIPHKCLIALSVALLVADITSDALPVIIVPSQSS